MSMSYRCATPLCVLRLRLPMTFPPPLCTICAVAEAEVCMFLHTSYTMHKHMQTHKFTHIIHKKTRVRACAGFTLRSRPRCPPTSRPATSSMLPSPPFLPLTRAAAAAAEGLPALQPPWVVCWGKPPRLPCCCVSPQTSTSYCCRCGIWWLQQLAHKALPQMCYLLLQPVHQALLQAQRVQQPCAAAVLCDPRGHQA